MQEFLNLVSEKNHNMIYEVLATPLLIESALSSKIEVELPKSDRIIFAGIGTSGLTGEFMKTYFTNIGSEATIEVYRAPKVPKRKDALYVTFSYSGTTLEILNAIRDLREHGYKPIVVSKGGYLEKYATKHNLPFIKMKIPVIENVTKLETRSHLPFGITFFAKIFAKILGFENRVASELKEALNEIKKSIEYYSKHKEEVTLMAKKLAQAGRLAIIADYATIPVARRFRNQLGENSKRIAQWDYFPEMGHNLLCSLIEEKEGLLLFIFRRKSANDIVKKYYEVIDASFSSEQIINVNVNDEKYSWRTLMEPIFIGDLLSIIIADILNREAKPIKQVDIVKTKMKEAVPLP
ncbi:MAG: SIS domain-containing protein [Candidatus Korarchaeota archaeon]|nr:SIS domain-containing protein [Candidatus Korarchaeota archaeon]